MVFVGTMAPSNVLPKFAPASNGAGEYATTNGNNNDGSGGWGNIALQDSAGTSNDDFDLLAEYLLDGDTGGSTVADLPNFDFSVDDSTLTAAVQSVQQQHHQQQQQAAADAAASLQKVQGGAVVSPSHASLSGSGSSDDGAASTGQVQQQPSHHVLSQPIPDVFSSETIQTTTATTSTGVPMAAAPVSLVPQPPQQQQQPHQHLVNHNHAAAAPIAATAPVAAAPVTAIDMPSIPTANKKRRVEDTVPAPVPTTTTASTISNTPMMAVAGAGPASGTSAIINGHHVGATTAAATVPAVQQHTSIHHQAAPAPAQATTTTPAMPPLPSIPAAGPAGSRNTKSQAQIDRRRERNRILARRTRLRKKFFFESLQKEVIDLQRENMALKEITKSKLDPATASSILDGCNAFDKLPADIAEAVGHTEGGDGSGAAGTAGTSVSASEFMTNHMDKQDFSLMKSVQASQKCFVITDPSLQDNPIVYASDGFLSLTGYNRDEVLGRNCRFLQGTETSTEKIEQIRKAISTGDDVTVTLINYTADGSAFWNRLFIAALRDAQNNIVNFIGVIVKVVAPDSDDPEHGKRLPGDDTTTTTSAAVPMPAPSLSSSSVAIPTMKTTATVASASPTAVVAPPQEVTNVATIKEEDAAAAAQAAEGTVMAIENAVSAAVAAAPSVSGSTPYC